jgi:hypothetical protein
MALNNVSGIIPASTEPNRFLTISYNEDNSELILEMDDDTINIYFTIPILPSTTFKKKKINSQWSYTIKTGMHSLTINQTEILYTIQGTYPEVHMKLSKDMYSSLVMFFNSHPNINNEFQYEFIPEDPEVNNNNNNNPQGGRRVKRKRTRKQKRLA